jgi:hypothetical protein
MLLCIGREDAILKLYPRTPGCDWKFAPTHARFTSNPGEYIAGFRPRGLKRLEMLLRTCARKIVPEVAQEAACKEEDDAFCDGSTAAETVWWTLLRRQFTMPIGLAMGEMVLERLCTILIDS